MRISPRSTATEVALALLMALAACRTIERPATIVSAAPASAPGTALPALRSLDDAHAAGFRLAFDEFSDRARYIVSLSPT